jgi:hypothetical protein
MSVPCFEGMNRVAMFGEFSDEGVMIEGHGFSKEPFVGEVES